MARPNDVDEWLSEINLATVFKMLREQGVTEVLYKILPKNANSKNQVYLASDLSQLGKIPSGDVSSHPSSSQKSGKQEAVFRSALDFYWLDRNGQPWHAPHAQLIFYPQFPEVRFSGFLLGCKNPPSSLWVKERRGQEPDRILVLGMGHDRKVFGITLPPEAPAAREIRSGEPYTAYGALNILPMPGQDGSDGFLELVTSLCEIHNRNWVPSTRLDKSGLLVPCNATNCHGYTLESLLGIQSNGYSLPDFHGWEVKARLVSNSDKPGSSVVTMFTPEPTDGYYGQNGVADFVQVYGYPDTKGRDDRRNFGGIYRVGMTAHKRTNLRLVLSGFDSETRKYESTGAVLLLDKNDNVAASWSFTKLLDHWKIKHAQAAFVPSQVGKTGDRQYRFGRAVLLGEGADFGRLLHAFSEGRVYYDPGIKLEGISTGKLKAKARSQFRVKSADLPSLYELHRIVDVCEEAGY